VRLEVGAAIWRRENPHFHEHETRREITAAAMRRVTPWLEAGAIGRTSHVSFLVEDAWHTAFGAEVVVDTRQDPSFPRNALHVIARWERIDFAAGAAGRASVDARTYVGVAGSAVLALRGALARAGTALPASEQLLVGGGSTLRGYRAGHRIGDGLALLSAELRVPLTSPLNIGRFGVKTFADAGTPWQSGARLADQRFERGIGGGVYFGAAAFATNVDIAWPDDGKPRVHVAVGVTF
jgi:outer membrane protein assembly factor BamA